jgi:hypothetical protein
MKLRRQRKIKYAQTKYNKAWEWGVNRISRLMGEQSRKMSRALYGVYAAAIEANARGQV